MCEFAKAIDWYSNQLMHDSLDFQLLNNRGWLKMQKAIELSNSKLLESGITDIKLAIQSFRFQFPDQNYFIAEANLVDALNLKMNY